MTTHEYRPLSLRRVGETGLEIEWSDGHRGEYTWRWLREHCPCASCREQRQNADEPVSGTAATGPRAAASGKISLAVVRAGEIAGSPFHAVSVTPVGRYAYKIVWADGHDTGIYSFELLRQLCQCPLCYAARATR